MKMLKILMASVIIFALLNGCKKDDKDEDPQPTTGSVTFYATSDLCGYIDIYVSGSYYGTLTAYFDNTEPDCENSNHTVKFTASQGTYQYRIDGRLCGEITGNITIINGFCIPIAL